MDSRETKSIFSVALSSLNGLNEDSQQEALEHFLYFPIKKGEYLLREGDKSYKYAYLASGLLKIFSTSSSGNEVCRGFVLDNAFCGSCPPQSEYSPVNIQALEDSYLLIGDQNRLKEFSCLEIIETEIVKMTFLFLYQKEKIMLLDSSEERYLAFLRDKPELSQRLTQAQVASYLAIQPQSLSRIKRRLKDKHDSPKQEPYALKARLNEQYI